MKIPFFDIDNWREIVATLARNKTRTFLTAFGIFWGTAMLAMLWGGAQGFKGVMFRNFAGLDTNIGGVSSGVRGMSYKGFNRGTGWTMTEQDIDLIRRTAPYMGASSQFNWSYVSGVYGEKSKSAQGVGVEGSYSELMNPGIVGGRFINDSDVRLRRKVVVVGRNLAAELFSTEEPVGKDITLNGIHFTVVGVASQLGEASIGARIDDSFILPATTLRNVFNLGTTVHFFVFSAKPGHKPSDNKQAIIRALRSNHPIHPDDEHAISFQDFTEMFDMVNALFAGISILAFFVGFGSLMAGVIGVGNIMWIIVKERTHEFGIRRAIGAKARDITAQVLSESVLLTLVAGVAGVCFAAGVLAVADKITYSETLGNAGFEISFYMAVGIVAAFIVLGSAAGIIPAIKAMKIKPIEAIRDK